MRNPLRLVGTELRRFRRRRAVRWLVALSLLIALVVNGIQLARSSTTTSYQPGSVIGEVPASCRAGTHEGRPLVDLRCLERSQSAGFSVGDLGPGGAPVYFAQPSDRQVRVGRTFSDTVAGLGIAFSLLGILLGATFLAAEFGASGLGTQLLFEPRRWLLYGAKAVAIALGCAAVALLLVVWTGLGQFAASALRGSTDGIDGGWLLDRAGDTARVAAACSLAGLCAMAVGALARRTVVAVGIFFGVVIATGFLIGPSWGRPIARVSPMNGIFAMASGDFSDPEVWAGLRSLGGAVVVAGAWAVGLSILAGWWLSRTEIR